MSIGEEIFNIGNNNFCSKLYGYDGFQEKYNMHDFILVNLRIYSKTNTNLILILIFSGYNKNTSNYARSIS